MNEMVKPPQATEFSVLGPDSMMWKKGGETIQGFMAATMLLLQVSHPVVGAGVGAYSVFKSDPWGRLRRTGEWGMRMMYGGPQGAPKAGKDLRELHRNIKGVDQQGRKFFALDPEAYTWVHMTGFVSLIKSKQLFSKKPFTKAEEEALYKEWIHMGHHIMGIRWEDMPANAEEFWKYYDNMVAKLEPTEVAHYIND